MRHHSPQPSGPDRPKYSLPKRLAIWSALGGTSIVIMLVSLWFTGPLQDRYAQWFWDDDAERTVQVLISDLRSAGLASSSERRSGVEERARSRTTPEVKDSTWRPWEVNVDPYVWTRLELNSADETRSQAFVRARHGSTWALRRAKSGCWALYGDFHLVRTEGTWKISKLPHFQERCRRKTLQATWRGGSRRRGVIAWNGPGTYQRIDPLDATYSHPRLLKEAENATRAWAAVRTWDVNDPLSHTETLPYDGDLTTGWGAARPVLFDAEDSSKRSWGTLTYRLPDGIVLTRIRIHNGLDLGPQFERVGRVNTATISAGGQQVSVALKDRIGTQYVDCYFGPTTSVRITITGVWPKHDAPTARSDVAFSHIDFWGMPADASVANDPSGMWAWSDVDRRTNQADFAECGSEPPPAALIAPIVAPTPSPTPSPAPSASVTPPSSPTPTTDAGNPAPTTAPTPTTAPQPPATEPATPPAAP